MVGPLSPEASASGKPMSTDLRSNSHAGIAALVRLGWMAFGVIALAITAMTMAAHPTWTLGWRDAAFWGTALVMGVLRYVDVTRFGGETADGTPATTRDLRNYLLGLTLAVSAAWAVVHSVDL
jgi:hypothetical protein